MLSRSLLLPAAILIWSVTLVSAANIPNTGMADPAALISAFDQYAASQVSSGGVNILVVPLTTFQVSPAEVLTRPGVYESTSPQVWLPPG